MFMVVWNLHNIIRRRVRFSKVGISWSGIAQDVE